ncbi:LOW QUALITY PROTEIN: putative germin-like protein 2-1 [Cinnamomum micranthum f. kanehirae]|uniref:Putative germin-like protein 2-1 n=1 Tax=Cinnamomum micranthum f. kanehirae TaxID=337451 RepID=A0A3S4NUL7_9MAGN|nr:LOW QUALITY PROTEIN: putative germin-like protein 2-1 [Cinnamomum micranthum f. kanehirae]
MGCLLCVHPELSLEIINYFLVHLEGFSQNIVGNWRFRSKYGVSNGDYSWILTAETGNSYSRCVANIGLEVDEVYWKDKHITLIEDLGYKCIIVLVGKDKADVERPFEDSNQRDPKSVESRYLVYKGIGHIEPNFVHCVARIEGLSSQNPGAITISSSIYGSNPFLANALQVEKKVLTVETCNGYSRCMSNIGLEVNEAYWEDEHISHVEDLAYESIIVLVGEDKAHVERPFDHRQYLRGTRALARISSEMSGFDPNTDNGDYSWVLTAETGNSYNRCVTNIGLEVNEVYWKDEHISLVKDLGYQVFLNGRACKDPKLVKADDFHFERLDKPANTSNIVGSKVTIVFVDQIAGLNTLGISLASIDFAPYRENPPHTHPCAIEILTVLERTIYVGFVLSNQNNNTLITKVFNKDDVFVFPIGLIHFQANIGHTPAVVIAVLSSQNPSVITIVNFVFGSNATDLPQDSRQGLPSGQQSN